MHLNGRASAHNPLGAQCCTSAPGMRVGESSHDCVTWGLYPTKSALEQSSGLATSPADFWDAAGTERQTRAFSAQSTEFLNAHPTG